MCIYLFMSLCVYIWFIYIYIYSYVYVCVYVRTDLGRLSVCLTFRAFDIPSLLDILCDRPCDPHVWYPEWSTAKHRCRATLNSSHLFTIEDTPGRHSKMRYQCKVRLFEITLSRETIDQGLWRNMQGCGLLSTIKLSCQKNRYRLYFLTLPPPNVVSILQRS